MQGKDVEQMVLWCRSQEAHLHKTRRHRPLLVYRIRKVQALDLTQVFL